jgi:hypothetical protein
MSLDYTKDKLAGDLLDAANPDVAAKSLMTIALVIAVGAAGTAGTPLAESEYTAIPFDAEVLSCSFVAASAVAQDPANTATFILAKFDAAGANKTTVASQRTLTGGGGSTVAKAGYNMPIVAGTQLVVGGGCFSVEVTKQGTGVATPAGNITVTLRRRNV